MDRDELQGLTFNGAPVRKIGTGGLSLLSAMRSYPQGTSDGELVRQVVQLYDRLEMHEIGAALERPSPSAGRERVAQLYEQLGRACSFSTETTEARGYWRPTFSVKGPPSDGMIIAHLVGAVVRLDKTWAEIDEATYERTVAQAAQRLNEGLNGKAGWTVFFPGSRHRLESPKLPPNMRFHVMDELVWRSKTGEWNPSLAVLGPGGQLVDGLQMIESGVRDDPATQHTDATFVLIGLAYQDLPVAKDLLAEPPWIGDLAEEIERLTSEEQPAGDRLLPHLVAVKPLGEAQTLLELLTRRDNLMQVVHLARDRAEDK